MIEPKEWVCKCETHRDRLPGEDYCPFCDTGRGQTEEAKEWTPAIGDTVMWFAGWDYKREPRISTGIIERIEMSGYYCNGDRWVGRSKAHPSRRSCLEAILAEAVAEVKRVEGMMDEAKYEEAVEHCGLGDHGGESQRETIYG